MVPSATWQAAAETTEHRTGDSVSSVLFSALTLIRPGCVSSESVASCDCIQP